jgi:hypothetical protein
LRLAQPLTLLQGRFQLAREDLDRLNEISFYLNAHGFDVEHHALEKQAILSLRVLFQQHV